MDYWYPVKHFIGDLMKTFQVDVSKDVNNVHPPRFCLKCLCPGDELCEKGKRMGGGGGGVLQ